MWSFVNDHGGFTLVCISVFLLSVVASDHGNRVSPCHGGGCVTEFSVERFQIIMEVLIRVALIPHFGSKSSICSKPRPATCRF